ncbi:hypothetical protein EST38_g7149 [Candolleomyces aberdarensis]|uniref:Uncharacterized protein n=1 Tax=Candolleomyces aberdarensis TaxID=2316362 RepID=A0A4Q2DHZ9_9AGAR|nr:hypothetical protein EST38_g7149 [Candolleomyces aberdarensis]
MDYLSVVDASCRSLSSTPSIVDTDGLVNTRLVAIRLSPVFDTDFDITLNAPGSRVSSWILFRLLDLASTSALG